MLEYLLESYFLPLLVDLSWCSAYHWNRRRKHNQRLLLLSVLIKKIANRKMLGVSVCRCSSCFRSINILFLLICLQFLLFLDSVFLVFSHSFLEISIAYDFPRYHIDFRVVILTLKARTFFRLMTSPLVVIQLFEDRATWMPIQIFRF